MQIYPKMNLFILYFAQTKNLTKLKLFNLDIKQVYQKM